MEPAVTKVSGRRRRVVVRVVTLLILGSLVAAGWRSRPGFERWVELRKAGRAIAEGKLDDARGRLELLVAEKPGEDPARLLLVEVARRQGRITEAEEILQRAVELGLPLDRARRERDSIRAARVAERGVPHPLPASDADPEDAGVRRTPVRR